VKDITRRIVGWILLLVNSSRYETCILHPLLCCYANILPASQGSGSRVYIRCVYSFILLTYLLLGNFLTKERLTIRIHHLYLALGNTTYNTSKRQHPTLSPITHFFFLQSHIISIEHNVYSCYPPSLRCRSLACCSYW
jgi:hypothetical protein